MELFHGSQHPISEIESVGAWNVFGGLFATHSKTAALSHGGKLHLITSPRPLSDYELNYEVPNAYEIALEIADNDESIADAIMSPSCELENADGWELQRMRGELAFKLGYTSVEMLDEHGTTYLCLPGCTITAI